MISGTPFRNKGIIVTGGGTGLGRELCLKLSRYGARIYTFGRTETNLSETKRIVSESGGELEYNVLDIRKYDLVNEFVKNAFQNDEISGLVNNAAGNFISKTEDLSMNAFKSVVDIVLMGSINTSIQVAREWMERGKKGSVVNILTSYADTGSAYVTPSAAAKGGLRAFTKSVAVEWGPKGIRTNGVAPGPFKTEGAWKNLIPDESYERVLMEKNPMKRLGTTKEISELISYLLSDYSSFINGEVITIDGGEWIQGAGQFNMLSQLGDDVWEVIKNSRVKKE